MNETYEQLIRRAYEAFNARDIEGALAVMHPDVDWPNGMLGGRLHGRGEVRDYWRAQFDLIDSHVEPRAIEQCPDGLVVVTVEEVVRDRSGRLLSEGTVEHRYRISDGQIRSMERLEASTSSEREIDRLSAEQALATTVSEPASTRTDGFDADAATAIPLWFSEGE